MFLLEKKGDLFSEKDDTVSLAHCISSDFALGAGIAVSFEQRFGLKSKLREKFPSGAPSDACCIKVGRVFNLVTKRHYYDKPTYRSIGLALMSMAKLCRKYGVTKVAMPRIGCGLDKLEWPQVRDIIQKVFANDNVTVFVYYR